MPSVQMTLALIALLLTVCALVFALVFAVPLWAPVLLLCILALLPRT